MTIYIDPTWFPWLLCVALVLGPWVFFYQLWIHYLAVMNLRRVVETKGDLKPGARFFGYWQVLPGGALLDWFGNLLLTLPFLDLPAHTGELITGRLQRYVNDPRQTWRKRWAWAFSDDLLNDFQHDGPHVKRPDLLEQ